MECFAWIAVFDGSQLGVARTASFTLPNIIRDLIMEEGMELGDADDHGNHNPMLTYNAYNRYIH
jgi:non-canonical (house-cleaning) NTP pyrophosphatase